MISFSQPRITSRLLHMNPNNMQISKLGLNPEKRIMVNLFQGGKTVGLKQKLHKVYLIIDNYEAETIKQTITIIQNIKKNICSGK